MKSGLAILLGGLAMFTVAVLGAFLSLRMAIHGREVAVPNLANMSDSDAADAAKKLGLNLSVENRFYSPAVAPNHVLSQLPIAGSRVRRGWPVRVTESLGPLQVAVPDVTGQSERPASLVLHRLQLDAGTVAHIPAPGPAGIVLAQSPSPNSHEMNGPKVALLVSDEETSADQTGFVMPQIVGMTLGAASLWLSGADLHIASAQQPEATPAPGPVDPNAVVGAVTSMDAVTPATPVSQPPQAFSMDATITSQSPAPGHRVTRADAIRVTLAKAAEF